ncbi:MAG TPA: response regulator transcription factor [Streptosporangiaceae bacterium]|nr:response regulator transcription factor [Streptosporangiaceae bacterium]
MAARHPDRREPGPKTSILLAEHEPEVAEMSARYLRRDGLRVRLVTSPEPTLAELTGGPDAAAVIDLTMPGLDPRRIRQALRTPVIFLVADGAARPRGLAVRRDAAGARRWLARPFSPRQLVALVRDVLAGDRDPAESPEALANRSLGELRLDGASRTAVADGHHVPLTAAEFAVLAVMADNPGRVVARRQLLAAAGRQTAGDRAADVYVAQLRAKLGSAWRIRTVRGAGYALDR